MSDIIWKYYDNHPAVRDTAYSETKPYVLGEEPYVKKQLADTLADAAEAMVKNLNEGEFISTTRIDALTAALSAYRAVGGRRLDNGDKE